MTEPSRRARALAGALLRRASGSAARAAARAAGPALRLEAARVIDERFNRLILTSPSEAERAVRAAATLAAVDRGPRCRGAAHRMHGVLAHLSGRPRDAEKELGLAAAAFRDAELPVETGDIHRALIDVRMRAGDDRGARRAARDAVAWYRRSGRVDSRRLGSVAMNLGNLYHLRDAHQRALRSYAEARRYFAAAGEPRRLANVDYNRANVLTTLDRIAEARTLYEKAREVFRAERLKALVAQSDYALAGLDLIEGLLDPAVRRLSDVREDLVAGGDRLRTAHVDLEMAHAFLRLNRPVDAEQAADRAARFFRRAGHLPERAACLGVLGGAALQQDRPAGAVRFFRSAAALERRGRNRVAVALFETGLSQAESRAGRLSAAVASARRAAAVLGRAGLLSRQARALAVGADAELASGRIAPARRTALRALRLAKHHRDSRVELAALLVLARADEAGGKPARAYRRLLAAERCVDRLRTGVTQEESRLAFALDKSIVYESLVMNRLRLGSRAAIRQALVFAERGKARMLAERLTATRGAILGEGTVASRKILRRLQELERELALSEARLEDSGGTPGLRGRRRARLTALTGSRLALVERLRRADPGRAAWMGLATPDPWSSAKALQPGETVLEYTQGDGYFHLFLVDRDGVEAFERIAPVDQVRDGLDLLRFQLGKGVLGEAFTARFESLIEGTLRGHFERLFDQLLAPVAERIENRILRIVPHGILHGLPFHALESGGRALIDRCVVSYSPSLSVMGLWRQPRAASRRQPLVLGVPDGAAPQIEAEVDTIRHHLRNARVLRGVDATTAAIQSAENRPPLLHVACHGFWAEGDPASCGLRMGDAWISLPEIQALRNTADLVVLSGCQTGRGRVYSGDEWVGLVRGFLQAGARAVVASLWEVHDQSAVFLMNDFYGALVDGSSVAAALTLAQRNARGQGASALRWAPFMTIGDPLLKLDLRKVA